MATFPNFYELEQKYGSIVRGLAKVDAKDEEYGQKEKHVLQS